jgi:hypothetical protein
MGTSAPGRDARPGRTLDLVLNHEHALMNDAGRGGRLRNGQASFLSAPARTSAQLLTGATHWPR